MNTGRASAAAARPQSIHGGSKPARALSTGILAALALALILLAPAWPLTAWSQTTPNQLVVDVPPGTNNSAGAGTKTCTLPGTCTGGLSTGSVTDDVLLTSITFGSTTFSSSSDQIVPGLASVFLAGGGGTNVNAEWGDNDDASDGIDNPFNRAGWPIPPTSQESTVLDVINDSLLMVFRALSLAEGIDGEDQNFTIDLDFIRGVIDDDPLLDTTPEIIIFERGLNSDVDIRLLLADGGLTDTVFVSRTDFVDTGFDLDTLEIPRSQALGIVGLDLNEFSGGGFDPASDTVIGVRFGSAGNGADIFGVFGTTLSPVDLRDYADAPESYGTSLSNNGPRHLLNNRLFIGDLPSFEDDGEPSLLADQASDEVLTDAFVLPSPATPLGPGDTYSMTVIVENEVSSGAEALLCGWIDFNDDGLFANADGAVGALNAERACTAVPNGSISTGANPTEVTLDFILPNDIVEQPAGDEFFFSRFRITTDWSSSSDASPLGDAGDGEVEDHRISSAGTLPVSVIGFDSHIEDDTLSASWTTASETHNAGFHLWGDEGRGLRRLTSEAIPAKAGDATTSRHYTVRLEGIDQESLRSLALSAIDYRGHEEFYGEFEPGITFGRGRTVAAIDWIEIGRAARQRGPARYARSTNTVNRVSVTFSGSGMAEVLASDLNAAGLDLEGVATDRIAVALKGEAVAREIIRPMIDRQGIRRFGPESGLRFWVRSPSFPDALYLDHYHFQISETPALAKPARVTDTGVSLFADRFEGAGEPSASRAAVSDYWATFTYAENRRYHFSSPLADPWYAAMLRADADNVHEITFDLDPKVRTDQPARLAVRLGGLTDFPADPDHHAVVRINGRVVDELFFEGASVQEWSIRVPVGLLVPGSNQIDIVAAGGTDAPFDLFLLDALELSVRRSLEAIEGRLEFSSTSAELMRAEGLQESAGAYAWQRGELLLLPADRTGDDGLLWHTVAGAADYWIGNADRLLRPAEAVALSDDDLLSNPRHDFLIIAHSAFVPLPGESDHPLTRFIQARSADGWNPGLFRIEDIQARYGWNMPLPDAVTRFLADADIHLDYEHVLLVGSDSYDYRDTLGLGSISFIPTRYAATQFISHTPSDALLADLDGDGLADKSIGRWPVRSVPDLESIVQKTLDWDTVSALDSAVWLADSQDPRQSSFIDQVDRMLQPLVGARWPFRTLRRIHFDEVIPSPGMSVADTARSLLFSEIEQGRTLTGFVGHGSPSVWTFQGLLSPNDLADLDNEGLPTLITTMTCYTSYFVSPRSDTVAHRWMNGYGVDDLGQPLPGRPNGAVGIHGASTLSNYLFNERFARDVVSHQLDGKTLGQSISAARQRAHARGMSDQVINWTLLGDPTLRLD